MPSNCIGLILWILCTICEKGNIKGSAVWILCNFNHKSTDFKTHKAQCGKIAYKTASKSYSEYMIKSIKTYQFKMKSSVNSSRSFFLFTGRKNMNYTQGHIYFLWHQFMTKSTKIRQMKYWFVVLMQIIAKIYTNS